MMNESQGGRNNFIPSHSEASNSITPPADTVSEQDHDVVTSPGISNNTQIFYGLRVSSRSRVQQLSRKLNDSIESGFNHDWITFQSTFEMGHDLILELEEKICNPEAFAAEMMVDIMYFHQAMQQEDSDHLWIQL